jgi:hypothetical protein
MVMPPRFPKLRPDGSFCVEVTLRVEGEHEEELAVRVDTWFRNWVQNNRFWDWFGERRDYFDEFGAVPSATTLVDRELRIQLQGKPGAKWWKDWLALRIIKELQAAFPKIKDVEAIKDCPGG